VLDDLTPTVKDACNWCGRDRQRISDLFRAPKSLSEAKHDWVDCVITQGDRWAYCPRADKGWVRHELERVSMERRRA
jgi:hypothetical protein